MCCMMEIKENVLCAGCLCVGRKMLMLEDYRKKKCFLQIIDEMPTKPSENIPVSLCWECEAIIVRFIKFKKQVIDSYTIFQNYLKQNLELTQIKKVPNLKTHKIVDISLQPDVSDTKLLDKEIKTEKDWEFDKSLELKLKNEDYNSVLSNNDDDDDEVLIEVAKRNKKSDGVLNSDTKTEDFNETVTEVYREIELSQIELEEERRSLALKEDYLNAIFKCEKCILAFPNADDLEDHINLKHMLNASKYRCKICDCSFAREVSYNYHAKRHKRRFQCIICGENFGSKRAASKHYGLVHCQSVDYDYELNIATNSAVDGTQEELKGKPSAESPSFPCELCVKTFRWKTSLRKHLETHRIETGQKRKPYCETCRLSFTTTSNLQKHVKTSSKHQIQLKLRKLKESPSEDNVSPEKQRDRIEQIKHSVNSEREMFPCPQCEKRFQWRGNLARHLHSHAARAKGDLVCKPCDRTFSSKATYEQHMRVSMKHVSENDFKYMCSECGKKFANKTRLRDHVEWDHLKNFIHRCTQCQKAFKSHTSLYLHKQNVHEKDQAGHLCHHCGKAFPNQAKLRGHVAGLHSREAPYRCGACAARFSWHSCLSRHVRRVHRKRDH